jgi:hypothetical protein
LGSPGCPALLTQTRASWRLPKKVKPHELKFHQWKRRIFGGCSPPLALHALWAGLQQAPGRTRLPPPRPAVQPLAGSPGNPGPLRLPPTQGSEGRQCNHFYQPTNIPGCRRREFRKLGLTNWPGPLNTRLPGRGRWPCRHSFSPRPPPLPPRTPRGQRRTPALPTHFPVPPARRSSKSQTGPPRPRSGCGKGFRTSWRRSPKARPLPSASRPSRPTFLSSFSSWEIGGVYGAPGRRFAGWGNVTSLPLFPHTCTPWGLRQQSQPSCGTPLPTSLRAPDTQIPHFLPNTSPPPPFGVGPSMRKCPYGTDRQARPPIKSRGERVTWPIRCAEVAGTGHLQLEETRRRRALRQTREFSAWEPHLGRRGEGCLFSNACKPCADTPAIGRT